LKMAAEPLLVKAVFKFKGTNNDELKFKKGDIITITQKEDGGWWEGTLDGKTGWFPSNYVEELSKESKEIPSPTQEISEDVLAKNIDYRQQVISDLLEKEQEFVSDLRGLLNQYLQPLHHADILTDAEYSQLVGNIEELIEAHQRLNSSLEDVRRSQPRHQRLGQVFLQHGAGVRAAHLTYWANHPRAVCILEKHRDKLNNWLDNCQTQTNQPPGLMVLTTGLSRPFRQLERLAGAIQEVAQHLEDDHVDRGDTQRSIGFYKESASEAARARRQRELELEVLTGTIRGWEGEGMEHLGDIIKMGAVVVGHGPNKKDKYLVLFPGTLLMLSVSNRLSAFIYEGKLPLSGLSITRQEGEGDTGKDCFDISGPLIETITCTFPTRSESQDWHEKLSSQIRTSRQSAILPSKLSVQPLPPPHKTGLQPSGPVAATASPAITRSPRTGLASRGQGQGVQGWKMTCLRPAPPTRSFFQADKRNTLRRKEVEQSSYEDDLQILRVIEAYCVSKHRQTITNSAMLDSTPLLTLADEADSLEDSRYSVVNKSNVSKKSSATSYASSEDREVVTKVDRLEREVTTLAKKLDQETQARKKLQEILMQSGVSIPVELNLQE